MTRFDTRVSAMGRHSPSASASSMLPMLRGAGGIAREMVRGRSERERDQEPRRSGRSIYVGRQALHLLVEEGLEDAEARRPALLRVELRRHHAALLHGAAGG